MPEPPSPDTLLARTQGPNAVPVAVLIARAERAVEEVKRDYLPFLRARLPDLSALNVRAAEAAGESDVWRELMVAVIDIRSSSATAGYDQLSAVAGSLEWLLEQAPPEDRRIAEVVRLHIEALARLIADGVPNLGSPKVQNLLTALGRASDYVTRG